MKSFCLISQSQYDAPKRGLRTRFLLGLLYAPEASAFATQSRLTTGSLCRTLNKCASCELARPDHFSWADSLHQITSAVSRDLNGRFKSGVPLIVVPFT